MNNFYLHFLPPGIGYNAGDYVTTMPSYKKKSGCAAKKKISWSQFKAYPVVMGVEWEKAAPPRLHLFSIAVLIGLSAEEK